MSKQRAKQPSDLAAQELADDLAVELAERYQLFWATLNDFGRMAVLQATMAICDEPGDMYERLDPIVEELLPHALRADLKAIGVPLSRVLNEAPEIAGVRPEAKA